jgi:triacylglycerol lipase
VPDRGTVNPDPHGSGTGGGNTLGTTRRRSLALAAAFATLLMTAGCMRPGPGTPTTTAPTTSGPTTPTSPPGNGGGGRRPVIFVHGFGGSATQWTGVMGQFRNRGYASNLLSAISYNSQVGIETSAKTLEAEVDRVIARTGAARVDVVSHSQGSMVAKTCIIIGGCKGKVAHWETMSGVDNGTANEIIIARGTRSNEDVQGRTPLRKALQDGWQEGIVAQGVKVQVHWSANDGIVVPGSLSQEPPPARNIAKPGLNHLNIYSNSAVISEVVTFFAS